jgi:hypothetical protein
MIANRMVNPEDIVIDLEFDEGGFTLTCVTSRGTTPPLVLVEEVDGIIHLIRGLQTVEAARAAGMIKIPVIDLALWPTVRGEDDD